MMIALEASGAPECICQALSLRMMYVGHRHDLPLCFACDAASSTQRCCKRFPARNTEPPSLLLQSIGQADSAPGNVQTASVGDNGVTNLSTGPAKYDVSIQKLTIPGVNFTLSCPTGLRVSWTSGQPMAQTQQPVNAQGELSPPETTSRAATSP